MINYHHINDHVATKRLQYRDLDKFVKGASFSVKPKWSLQELSEAKHTRRKRLLRIPDECLLGKCVLILPHNLFFDIL